jgi:hypothetical protein
MGRDVDGLRAAVEALIAAVSLVLPPGASTHGLAPPPRGSGGGQAAQQAGLGGGGAASSSTAAPRVRRQPPSWLVRPPEELRGHDEAVTSLVWLPGVASPPIAAEVGPSGGCVEQSCLGGCSAACLLPGAVARDAFAI